MNCLMTRAISQLKMYEIKVYYTCEYKLVFIIATYHNIK